MEIKQDVEKKEKVKQAKGVAKAPVKPATEVVKESSRERKNSGDAPKEQRKGTSH